MAHFAELNEENVVLSINVVNNDVLLDENGVEQESLGISFLHELYGHDRWKQCSYNDSFRKAYPAPGWFFLESADCFVPPKYYPSWILDPLTGDWLPPVPPPDYDPSTHELMWNEETEQWNVFEIPEKTTTTTYIR